MTLNLENSYYPNHNSTALNQLKTHKEAAIVKMRGIKSAKLTEIKWKNFRGLSHQ